MDEQLKLLVSKEHANYALQIDECFKDSNLSVSSYIARNVVGDLPMQIMIMVASGIVGNVSYDLLKLAIKKFYKKFPEAHVAMSHKNVTYNIESNLDVNVLATPERSEEFKDVHDYDSMVEHIIKNGEKR